MALTCLLNTGVDVPSYHNLLLQRLRLASWHSCKDKRRRGRQRRPCPSTPYVPVDVGGGGAPPLFFLNPSLLLITSLGGTPSYRQMMVGTMLETVRKVAPNQGLN
jgi:hypothetical protein